MKLELKHLAPYLPYGLKVKDKRHEKRLIYDLDALRSNSDYPVRMTCESEKPYGAMLSETLPILRPLSDLYKQIEWEDGTYAMTDSIFDVADDCYATTQSYIERHFDVFGLIEKGLAIDINTVPLND